MPSNDIVLQMIAYSLIVVPVAILVIGIILFFYKPIHRLTVGVILVTFGSLGLIIVSGAFDISLSYMDGRGITVYMALIAVEIMTIIVGVVSLVKSANKSKGTGR